PWLDYIWPSLSGHVDPANPAVTTSLWVCLIRAVVFFGKTILIIFVFMWVRWSLPRFRFDQLMMLAWRALIPMSLALLVVTGVVVYLFGAHRDAALHANGSLALALLVSNIIVLAGSMYISTLLPPAPETNRRVKV